MSVTTPDTDTFVAIERYERTFPSRPEALREVRAWVARVAARAPYGCPRIDDAVLCGDELATNAYRYAGGAEFTVACDIAADAVRLEVTDQGPDPENSWHPPAAGERGRGLVILTGLATAWTRRTSPAGGSVYTCLITWPAPSHGEEGA